MFKTSASRSKHWNLLPRIPLAYRRLTPGALAESEKHLPLKQSLRNLQSIPQLRLICGLMASFQVSDIVLLILVTIAAGVLVVIWWYPPRWIRQIRAVPKPIIFADPASCKKILACKGYNIPKEENLYTDVESRAIPNKRLILAFEIDNSFTTSDGERRREFNSEAVKAIRMTEAKVSTSYQTTFSFFARAFQEHRVLRFPSDFGLKSLVCVPYMSLKKQC